jgi:hypothetical protein
MQSYYAPLTSEQFLHPVNNLPRLVHDLFQQSLERFTGRVFHVHLTFFRLPISPGSLMADAVGAH